MASAADELQQLILDTLEAHGSIPDSRQLPVPGVASGTAHDQTLAVKAALDSLAAKLVRADRLLFSGSHAA